MTAAPAARSPTPAGTSGEQRRSGRTVARWLFALSVAGIIYGSLYPFDFAWRAPDWAEAVAALTDAGVGWRRGNVVANVLLFLPYGLFAALAWGGGRPTALGLVVIVASGVLLAVALQVLQLWLPLRVPALADAGINGIGLLAGIAIARWPWPRALVERAVVRRPLLILPLLLMSCWFAYKWAPFVPTLDVHEIVQGLKPLLAEPRLEALVLARGLVGWLVFALLWRDCGLGTRWLWFVMPGAELLQVGIAHNPVALDSLLAGVLAPFVAWWLQRAVAEPAPVVLLLLIALLIVHGLAPFTWGASPFHWLPFTGFLTGSMAVNLLSLLLKAYLYGGLVWLVYRTTARPWAALVIPVVIVGLIEVAQTRIAGRVAEITDPLLCVLVWSVLRLAQAGGGRGRRGGSRQSSMA